MISGNGYGYEVLEVQIPYMQMCFAIVHLKV